MVQGVFVFAALCAVIKKPQGGQVHCGAMAKDNRSAYLERKSVGRPHGRGNTGRALSQRLP
jgi:hypothetical protein